MKRKVRVGAAVVLTAVLFTFYDLILDYFETPAWIPLLVFVFVLRSEERRVGKECRL